MRIGVSLQPMGAALDDFSAPRLPDSLDLYQKGCSKSIVIPSGGYAMTFLKVHPHMGHKDLIFETGVKW